jgi:serine/threonine protein kinase
MGSYMTGAPIAPGCRIGDYELIHELGRGAIGETFATRVVAGPRAGQIVCLKVLAKEFRDTRSAERDSAVRYLRHEARVVAQLEHPNIARLLDSGVASDVWYLAFELVDGANLSELLAHGALGPYHVMHVGLELSKALACAHERDVLHRDIKPSNILISTAGEVKLVDFGLAKLNAGAASQFSQHVGTPRYFSPEQLRGEALTPATDIYAVGLVLFELLMGSHPFYSADVDVFRRNVLEGRPQTSLHGRGFPRDLVALIEGCIRLDSSKRYANGTALHNALRALIDHCSRAAEGDLRELSVLSADDEGPDSQALTRLGELADRVTDIRDEAGDIVTRIIADPTEVYRDVTRVIPPAEAAAEAARTGASFGSESITGDLSRIARALTEQRSSGIEPAEPYRSGLRPADATPLLRRLRTRTTAHGQSPVRTSAPDDDQPAPIATPPRPWGRPSSIAALCLLLIGTGAAAVLLRTNSQPRVPSDPSAAATSPATVTRIGADQRPPATSSAAASVPQDLSDTQSGSGTADNPQPPMKAEDRPKSVPPAPDSNAIPPTNSSQKEMHARRSHVEPLELVSVTIGTIPYGEVIVDGKRVGRAPVVVKLSPGTHRVVGRSQELRRIETIVVSPEMNHIVLDLRNDQALP